MRGRAAARNMLFLSAAALCYSFYLGAQARVLSGVDGPAPSTPEREWALRAAVAFAASAAVITWHSTKRQHRPAYVISITGLSVALVLNAISGLDSPAY